ncbi:hypothetical protein [Streptomyces phaeochromogenes]
MAHSAPPTGVTPRAPKTPEHWNAIAGIIGAVVSVLTFLLGFIGLPAAGVDSPSATSATVTTTATVTATATSTAPERNDTSDGQPDSSAIPGEYWSGPLLFSGNEAYDLDLAPPEKDSEGGEMTFDTINEEREATFYEESMAIVPQGEHPNSAECTLLAKTQSASVITIPAGRSFCLITGAGRTAIVTINGLNIADGTVEADAQVWDKAQ